MVGGVMELDLHGMNTYQAQIAIDAALRRCGGGASPRPGLLARLPQEVHTVWRGGRAEVTIPWREGQPFPLEELFCFARPGRGNVTYLFDGAGQPVMPEF